MVISSKRARRRNVILLVTALCWQAELALQGQEPCDGFSVFSRAVSFQQGAEGYAGNCVTTIGGGLGPEYGSVDANEVALIISRAIFGAILGLIPAGSTIHQATLVLTVNGTPGEVESTGSNPTIHLLTEPYFDESCQAGSTVPAHSSTPAATLPALILAGELHIDVTASVQGWSDGAPNHGWLIKQSSNDGWDFIGAIHADSASRPKLIVCYTPPAPRAGYRVEETSPNMAAILLTASDSVGGGVVCLRVDPAAAIVRSVVKGAALTAESDVYASCEVLDEVDAPIPGGLQLGYIIDQAASACLAAGEHEVFVLELRPAPSAGAGGCALVELIEGCKTSPAAPLQRNIASSCTGETIEAAAHSGVMCLQGAFVRGDTNDDGGFDLSDAVRTLSCLFSDASLCAGCQDAADANDDGDVDVSDVVYWLSYIFLGGPAPPAPYPACGVDSTQDGLDCDESSVQCPAQSCEVLP